MVIKKMNRMFDLHGRTIGTILVVIIIIAFVGFFTPGFTSMLSPFFYGNTNAIGTVFGEDIEIETLRKQAGYLAIIYSLYEKKDINIRAVANSDYAMKSAVRTLPKLRAASKIGLTVSLKDIAKYLRDIERFQTNAKFDKKKFDLYVKNLLKKSGFNKQDLDEAVKQQIILRNLYDAITDKVIVTDDEIKTYFYNENTEYKVKMLQTKASEYKKKVKYSQKDILNFFKLQKNSYKIPARYKTIIARLKYDKYKKKAKKFVTDADILDYFKNGKEKFIKEEQRRLAKLAKEKIDKLSEYKKITPPPLNITYYNVMNYYKRSKKRSDDISSNVRKKIEDKLLDKKVKELAINDARIFAQEVYAKMEETPAKGAEIFQKYGKSKSTIDIISTGWLSENDDKIKGIGKEPKLIKAIEQIYQQIPISEAVQGDKAAYVAYLVKKEKERFAKFEEVKDKVKNDFIFEKALNMARQELRNLRLKVFKMLKKGKSLEQIKKTGIKFKDVPKFTGRYAPVESGSIVAELAAETLPREISEIKNTDNGAIFVYVESKKLPDDKKFKKKKSMLSYRYTQEKRFTAWSVFNDWVENNAKFIKEFSK